jgi:hypothetical protein
MVMVYSLVLRVVVPRRSGQRGTGLLCGIRVRLGALVVCL